MTPGGWVNLRSGVGEVFPRPAAVPSADPVRDRKTVTENAPALPQGRPTLPGFPMRELQFTMQAHVSVIR
ncbi:hypothetical protein GCM10007918_16300 [Piscinibacter gummiphilus]|nr:hypothetical protein GCM10007918_16300 [Piscinibacter gummiphilus]